MKSKILIICGPTASGKTKLGIKCANLFNGEIISADSMQIYKKLDIGTAKPTADELSQAKHHLVDIIEPNAEFSVGEYSKLAKGKINEIISQNKLPIIVGGTGLYIKSIIYPFTFAGTPKNVEIREKYNKILKENGQEFLYNILKEKDPKATEKIHLNDTKRIIRALEITEISANTKTELNCEENEAEYDPIIIALDMPREQLYERVNLRVDNMIAEGVIQEMTTLLKNNEISNTSQSMQAIGYKEFFPYINNETTLDEAVELVKKNTRNYAKRQLTFFRAFKDAKWFNPLEDEEKIYNYIKERLNYEN